ncbi:ADP-ribosylglycohydrolase [Treponema sp. JC4]|uniref:ADP-ribosylglycohydrolase family protein n=1 Tax=Treponema sp. JC4 TaxID=1124982 RepID=UPI00025B05CC|nr:ADP-ribosylglycohydrolase family protein [Treponema sp. JC4]EID84028.1 ADP-ribosylglycohydrolase [Treponema sp. JC4]
MTNTDISNLIYGVAVGDAMGFPVQFYKREQVKTFNVTGMISHKCGKYPAGTWSDDTSLTLALADSLGQTEDIDYSDIMNNFFTWISKGKFTPAGKPFDTGRTCFKALLNYSNGVEPLMCGGQGEYENGNGSIMRISPLVFYIQKKFGDTAFDKKDTFEVIHNVSRLTHAHPIALVGCDIYIAVLFALLKGDEKFAAMKFAIEKVSSFVQSIPKFKKVFPKYNRLTSEDFIKLPESKISSSGYIVDTLEAALWCFLTTETYRDCILKVVNLGNDTDTIGAVAGAMAGLYYGNSVEKGIPDKWKCALQNKVLIENIIKTLSIEYDSDYASKHVMLYL